MLAFSPLHGFLSETALYHGFLPLALSPISLSVPLQAFSAPPLGLREILSGFRFENVFSLHPHVTPTVAKRPGNFDEDGLVKLLLSDLNELKDLLRCNSELRKQE